MQYTDAVEALGARESRKAGNNTYWKRRENGDIAYRLHETDVVTFHANNTATLDSGGWMTPTTKDRMGIVANIGQRARVWYMPDGSRYFDGICINLATGAILNPRDMSQEDTETDATMRAISRYVGGFDVAWARSLIGTDGDTRRIGEAMTGDCWYCLLQTTDGATLGDATDNHDHLTAHLEEQCRPLSLVFNAYREVAYGDARFAFALDMSGLARGNGAWYKQSLQKNVREYLLRRLVSGRSVRPSHSRTSGYAVR